MITSLRGLATRVLSHCGLADKGAELDTFKRDYVLLSDINESSFVSAREKRSYVRASGCE